jgi:hypothetical protein
MNSKIIGISDFKLPTDERNAMLTFAGDNRHYSEFHFGDWKSFVVWNQTGIDDDGMVADRGLAARPTPRSSALPELNDWINATFDMSRLKLVRIHSLGDGVLVPHRDFVEFDSTPWTRVHVPLLTNLGCLHSEGDAVFHMRSGEIWFLDASNLHSAINYSAGRRLNLCLDFDLRGEPVEAALRQVNLAARGAIEPQLVKRPPLGDMFDDELNSLAATLNESNLRQAVGLLSKVHFFRDADIGAFFNWLPGLAERTEDASLQTKVGQYVRFLRDERKMGDRFDFAQGA